jgi:subtilase family serine protease
VNPVEEGESQATVEVRVDADDRIRETDENNNDGRFLIRFQYFHAVSLPQCLTLSPNGINWMDAPSTSSQAATISTENTGR